MRFIVAIALGVLMTGCQSPEASRDDAAAIVTALKKRITAEEAHRIALGDFEDSMQKLEGRPPSDTSVRLEWEVLKNKQERCSSLLEAFLSRSRKGDELWTYRTTTRPCEESGLALVRDGSVVEHLAFITSYVGR